MECEFTGHGNALLADWQPDVVHAHDWMVAHAAVALRRRSGAPLTATIHATEAGRNRGWVTTDLSTAIHGIEWWLANTSDAVITCSRTMRDEVRTLFGVDRGARGAQRHRAGGLAAPRVRDGADHAPRTPTPTP